jgi:sigma-E factor negative regulatory protein RseB
MTLSSNPFPHRVRFFQILLTAGVLIASSFSVAEEGGVAQQDNLPDARQLLEKMTSATRNLNYDGVFVYSRGNQLESMRIIHKVDEEGEVERLISLTGSSREVVRDNGDVTCIYSDDRSVMVDKGASDSKFLPSNLPKSISQISDYYSFTVKGEDRIAGRPTYVVEITPKDENRYVYRLWIDKESSLVLKSAIVNMQGGILETVLFTNIELPTEIPSDLMTPMSVPGYTWYTSEEPPTLESLYDSEWQAGWLPNGFSMHESGVQTLSDGQNPVEHQVYSDGLATVSLYIEKLEKDKDPMNGYLTLGAVNAFTVSSDEYQITAVGELPAQTVRKIASSVNHGQTERAVKPSSNIP